MAKTVGAVSKSTKRSYSSKTLKILFAFSGNKCANPDCTNPIIEPATPMSDDLVVGQICHIYAASDAGPRGKPDLTDGERNAPENLILCCPTHHVLVDGQYETYPAVTLFEWKKAQERKYRNALKLPLQTIGYSELEVAAKALMSSAIGAVAVGLFVIPPAHKIKKNGLSSSTALLLQMGSAKSSEVAEVLLKASQLDSNFPQRLRDGFLVQYNSLKSGGCEGDELFLSMYHWVGGGSVDQYRVAAGLCILAHLFVICDIFEK